MYTHKNALSKNFKFDLLNFFPTRFTIFELLKWIFFLFSSNRLRWICDRFIFYFYIRWLVETSGFSCISFFSFFFVERWIFFLIVTNCLRLKSNENKYVIGFYIFILYSFFLQRLISRIIGIFCFYFYSGMIVFLKNREINFVCY